MDRPTAIEWLIKKLKNRQNGVFDGFPVLSLDEIYIEAKKIEKEQHGKTWDEAINAHENRGHNISRSLVDFDNFYNNN